MKLIQFIVAAGTIETATVEIEVTVVDAAVVMIGTTIVDMKVATEIAMAEMVATVEIEGEGTFKSFCGNHSEIYFRGQQHDYDDW